jgi:hypothetical protein
VTRKRYVEHLCRCPTCRDKGNTDEKTRTKHNLINRFICTQDERGRRLFAGLLLQLNDGDRFLTTKITGIAPATLIKGLNELSTRDYRKLSDEGRTRIEGGGRKPSAGTG